MGRSGGPGLRDYPLRETRDRYRFWFDSYAYLGFLIFINLGVLSFYLLGVNETVLASELFIEMFLFSLIGLGLFYSISDGRMRAFTNDLLLRDSIEKLRESNLRDPLTGV